MRTHAERSPKRKGTPTSTTTQQKKTQSNATASITDNRPEATAQKKLNGNITAQGKPQSSNLKKASIKNPTAQRVIRIYDGPLAGEYTTKGGKDTIRLIKSIDKTFGKKLRRSWKLYLKLLAGSNKKYPFYDTRIFIMLLRKRYKRLELPKKKIRPNFPSSAYDLGRVTLGLQTGKDQSAFSPSTNDAALPHRFPYAAIQESTRKFITGEESSTDLIRWSDRLKTATEERLAINKAKLAGNPQAQKNYELKVSLQLGFFNSSRTNLVKAVSDGQKLTLAAPLVQDFLKYTNALHGNIPDYGPHSTVNIPVSDRLHLHFESGRLTPGSKAAGSMTPTRSRGLAMTSDGLHLVTTNGLPVKYDTLHPDDQQLLKPQIQSATTIDKDDLTGTGW
ncbi:hypothetical protein DMA11_20770 [Marinilabiliaceae bacterium JC017]|nr:hypothetical protein DMA11_20770 [Marinilabiliaceae bacterium JC017]